MVFDKIKSVTVVDSHGFPKVLYYCSCGGEVYMEASRIQSRLYFSLVCERCGAREPFAYFDLSVPEEEKLVRQFIADYGGKIKFLGTFQLLRNEKR